MNLYAKTTKKEHNQREPTGSFTKSDNSIRKNIISSCGSEGYALYQTLLSFRNTKTDDCFPSRSLLAEECNCSVRTVTRVLNDLYNNNFIQIESGNKNYCNHYFFPQEKFYEKKEVTRKNKVFE